MSVAKKPACKATECARLALPMMAQHKVEPNPHNYAVWFTYVSGENTRLKTEIDSMIDQDRPFTDSANEYLYSRFIAEDFDKKAVEQATQEAEALLLQIIQAMDTVSSNTDAYGEELNSYTDTLENSRITTDSLKGVVQNIIKRTQQMSVEGQKLSSRLAASSKEITTLRHDLERVSKESEEDFLTGLANRKAFDVRLAENIDSAKEGDNTLCLIMLDIDHFKKYNDKYGHQIGDEVLRQVARVLTDCVRGKDLVARYGGEEFAMILPDTPLSGGLTVAENVRRMVSSKTLRLKKSGDKLDSITVSLGVSTLHDDKADTPDCLISRADAALYRSKSGGRNKVTQESA